MAAMKLNVAEQLEMARKHLARVQRAWAPPDWSNLAMWGFYCLEALVLVAAEVKGISVARTHPMKVEAAKKLHKDHGLPKIDDLLVELNSARKSVAYGDIDMPRLDAEQVAIDIEDYFNQVEKLVTSP